MKKQNLLTTMLLLFALIVGSTSAWATDVTFTFTSNAWADANSGWTSGKNGNQMQSGRGVQVTTGASGANATTKNSYSNVSQIVVTYSTNASSGAGSISFQVGSGTAKSLSVTTTGGTTDRTLTYDFSPAETGQVKMTVTCNTNSIYVKSVQIVYSDLPPVATIGDLGITTLGFGAEGTFTPTITPATGLTESDYSVAWTEVENDLILLTEDGEYVAGNTKGNVNVTVTVSPVSTSYQVVSKSFTIKIVDPNAGDGTSDNPFRPSDAIDAYKAGETNSSTEYYVAGTISRIGNLENGALTYYISDDGSTTKELECYKGKNIGGAAFASTTDIEVGDVVTVKGGLNEYDDEVYLKTGNTIISITSIRTKVNIESFEADEPTLVIGETTETTVTNDVPAWTESYTYESNNTAVATVSASGVITAVAKGTARITVAPNIPANDANYRSGASKYVDITVSNPSHEVVFSVNGVESAPTSVEEGEAIVFPANPSDLGGKTFVGWAAAAIEGTADEVTLVNTATETMGNADKTYYAVFANESGSVETKTDELTSSITGVTGTGYSSWSNKQATNGSDAVYAGCNAGSYSSIQLNASNNNSKRGIISTTSGGKAVKVTVEWNSNNTSGRSLDVYGSNTAYTTVSDFNSAKGTKIGSITYGDGTTLNITNEYQYVGFYATSAIYLDKLSIDWESGSYTYSDYCTSVVDTKAVEAYGWATYIPEYNVAFEDGDAYVVTEVNTTTGAVTVAPVESAPANTPILLKGEGTKTMAVLTDAPAAPATNMLEVWDGTDKGTKVPYVLAKNGENAAGFKHWTGELSVLDGRVVMWLDNEISLARSFFFLDGEATGIAEMQTVKNVENGKFYNLNGQRVAQPTKGMYIVNGKKYIIK